MICKINVQWRVSTRFTSLFAERSLRSLLHYFAIIVFKMKSSSFSVIQNKQTRPIAIFCSDKFFHVRNHVTLLLSHQSETGTRTWGTQAGRNVACEKALVWGSCEKSRESSRSLARSLARSRLTLLTIIWTFIYYLFIYHRWRVC